MKGPDNSRYMKIIEKNTKLLSLNDVDSGNIVVNFSGEFLTGDNTKDVLAVYAVVKSLCAISSVDSVKVIEIRTLICQPIHITAKRVKLHCIFRIKTATSLLWKQERLKSPTNNLWHNIL